MEKDIMAVKVITDSTSYINEDIRKKLEIERICLNVSFEDETFKETEISNEEFYKKMEQKGIPASSQPATAEIEDKLRAIVSEGHSALFVVISSKMSGTFDSVSVIKNRVLEDYPEAEIDVVDSTSNCMQLGFAAIVAARAAKEGKSLQEVKQCAEENINRSRFLFIPDNLTYLKKGGRIGGASALIGNFLKLIPILTVENGVTTVVTKIRTKKKAIETLIERVISDISQFGLGEISVHHIDCIDEAKEVVSMLEEKLRELNLKVDISICDIGPVIGLHVGPGAMGIVYYTKRNLR